MNEFLSRHPIFNNQNKVYGYYIVSDPGTVSRIILSITESIASVNNDSVNISSYYLLPDHMTMFIDYTESLFNDNLTILVSKKKVVAVFGKSSTVMIESIRKIKNYGCLIALHFVHVLKNPALVEYTDIIQIDYKATSISAQLSMIKQYKNQVTFQACQVETIDDFTKSVDMGYSLFQGYFYLRLKNPNISEIKPLNTSLINTFGELNSPEPDFAKISSLIEHDLDLTYRLLKLVNSAYMAPKYRVKTISQALVFIGTRELREWFVVMILKNMKCYENSELIKASLIRGKLMALIEKRLDTGCIGSEAFFTGLFSMIDIIMNKDINTILSELPLPDRVKDALRGKNNNLKSLLSFVINYEQARWHTIDGIYPMNLIKPKDMVELHLEALNWSYAID